MKINRVILQQALKLILPGVDARGLIQGSSGFEFTEDRVFSFNDEISISHPIKVGFTGIVPAKEFYDLVNKLSSEEIDITQSKGELIVKGSRAKAGLRINSEINLPIEEMGLPEEDEFVELPKNFCEALKFCIFSASTDNTKPILTCLHITNKYVESSDNFRITRFDMKSKVFEKGGHLIPASTAKSLINYNPVEFALSEGWMHFRNKDDVMFSCRIFEESFPDFDEYLDIEGDEVEFPKGLSEMLDRAAVMSNGERVSLILEDNVLTVETTGDNGWFEENVKIDFDGEAREFAIQPEFLKTILKAEGEIVVGENMLKFEGENFIHAVQLLSPKKKG